MDDTTESTDRFYRKCRSSGWYYSITPLPRDGLMECDVYPSKKARYILIRDKPAHETRFLSLEALAKKAGISLTCFMD